MMSSDWALYTRAVLALIFVIALIVLCAALAKKVGLDKRLAGNKGRTSRLSVVETLYLSPKHRLVIVRSGEKEHLLLIGASGDLLIESYERDKAHEA